MMYNLSQSQVLTINDKNFFFITEECEWIKLDTEYGLFAKLTTETFFIPIHAMIRIAYEEASTPRTTIG